MNRSATADPARTGTRLSVERDSDVVTARQVAREIAAEIGFTAGELALIATAVSEVARNIVVYAGRGEITVSAIDRDGRRGISVVAEDEGPGIPDIEQAMQDGFSTGKSLGLGLPGARRLMNEFEIVSEVGKGTRILMSKWTA